MHLVPVALLKRMKMMKTCWNMHDLDRCVTALLSEHSSHLNPLETARVTRDVDNRHSPVHLILFLNYIHIVELFLLPGMRKHIPGKDTLLKETQLVDSNRGMKLIHNQLEILWRINLCWRNKVGREYNVQVKQCQSAVT